MWIGLPPGFMTPLRSPFAVQTRTRDAKRLRVSKPPAGFTQMQPCSSIWRTKKPISSMCAASITRTGFAPFAGFRVGLRVAMSEPIASVVDAS